MRANLMIYTCQFQLTAVDIKIPKPHTKYMHFGLLFTSLTHSAQSFLHWKGWLLFKHLMQTIICSMVVSLSLKIPLVCSPLHSPSHNVLGSFYWMQLSLTPIKFRFGATHFTFRKFILNWETIHRLSDNLIAFSCFFGSKALGWIRQKAQGEGLSPNKSLA